MPIPPYSVSQNEIRLPGKADANRNFDVFFGSRGSRRQVIREGVASSGSCGAEGRSSMLHSPLLFGRAANESQNVLYAQENEGCEAKGKK
mmetsp:Transcript_48188/g.145573  ORF Transcript_48188/g.145573 Transcript_48188/m.145573 type:complete len:90 (-) Transcript_48188:4-273(-)